MLFRSEKLRRDIPEFQPQISLEEGLGRVYSAMKRENRIPDSDLSTWEDRIIAEQRKVGLLKLTDPAV